MNDMFLSFLACGLCYALGAWGWSGLFEERGRIDVASGEYVCERIETSREVSWDCVEQGVENNE